MKSVLISIKPKWVEKIASGEKTIEVRKSRPKIETPFKCYIYMSQGDLKDLGSYSEWIYKNRMKVIGEFVCDSMYGILNFLPYDDEPHHSVLPCVLEQTCLDDYEIDEYLGNNDGYGWHISDLKIYDTPKELGEFSYPCPDKNYDTCYGCKYFYHDETEMCCKKGAVSPPQSWCYVEGL